MTTSKGIRLKAMRAVIAFFGSTQVSFFLGILGMFGAKSTEWGLSLLALGVVIDVLRAKYIFDWSIKKFRPNIRDYNRLIQYKDHNRLKYGGRIVFLSIATFSALTIISAAVLAVLNAYTTFFCEANVGVFLSIAENLSLQTREIPAQISSAGLECRSNFSRAFFSVMFYIFIAWIIVLYLFLEDEFTLFLLYKDYFHLRPEAIPDNGLKPYMRILIYFCFITFSLLGQNFLISNGQERWKFTESNVPFLLYTMNVVIIIYCMSFTFYTFKSQERALST